MPRTAQFGFIAGAILCSLASPAHAQDTGTQRSVEVSVVDWFPDASLRLSSDGPALPGTPIDLKSDLDVTDHQIPDIGFVLQPARRHRLRFELIVIRYDATATLARDIAFNGTIYHRGDTVTSALDWTAYNVGYEYDFIARPRAAVGLILELKGTEVRQSLTSAAADESRRTSVPAPGIGVAARGRVWPRVTVSGEFRGFVIPDSQNGHYGGRYVDVNGSATFDLAHHFGARAGVRWLNIRHLGEADTARLSLPGIYAGLVVTAR